MSKEVSDYTIGGYEALLEENQRLRKLTSEKVMSSTMLREFVAQDGGVTIGLEGGACALMAQAFGSQLYESEAINYIEASFDSPDYPDMGLITVTLKREAGKTPHQLRKEAEAERDALLAERDRLREALKNLRAATPSLTCESFHHARRDLHDHDEECPPFERWIAAALACNAALQGEQP